MEHAFNKALFIILANLTCFLEKNPNFILVYLADAGERKQSEFGETSERIGYLEVKENETTTTMKIQSLGRNITR